MLALILGLCASQNATEFEDFNITNTSDTSDFDFNITNITDPTKGDDTDEDFPYAIVILLSLVCIPATCYCLACIVDCCAMWYECDIKIKRRTQSTRKPRNVYPGIRRSDAKYLNGINRENEKYEKGELPDCAICLDPVKITKTSTVTLDCGHRFHTKCINGWIMSRLNADIQVTCPTCKQTFSTKPPEPEPIWYPCDSSDDSYDEY